MLPCQLLSAKVFSVFFLGVFFSSQAVMNRIHTISVPYAVMKACPLSWVQRVHMNKGKQRQSSGLRHVVSLTV